jgi:hypothetical protein
VSVAPEKLQSLTATVFAALIRIIPISPAVMLAGHPGLTPSLVSAPERVKA